jgi:segregation and condensation protein A
LQFFPKIPKIFQDDKVGFFKIYMDYSVKIEQFEGPLDLLLNLIEEEKLDITKISLAKVTDQYLDYIKSCENISLQNLSSFLSVAAKLILIKSQALLPLLKLDEEEEAEIQDLEKQLSALKVFKEIVPKLSLFFISANSSFAHKGMWGMQPIFCPPESLTANDLKEAFLVSLTAIPELEKLEEKIISDVISLEKKIADIQQMIQNKAIKTFAEIQKNSKDKAEVVVSFLAILELVKQKIIIARQGGVFDDIVFE